MAIWRGHINTTSSGSARAGLVASKNNGKIAAQLNATNDHLGGTGAEKAIWDTANQSVRSDYIAADSFGQSLASQHITGVMNKASAARIASLPPQLQRSLAPLWQQIGQ